MKDEINNVPMTVYIGLRPKLYANKIFTIEAAMEKWKIRQLEGYDDDEVINIIHNFEME